MATLPVFSEHEIQRAHSLLAARVALMLGRKFEEGDWASVYCEAKGIPVAGWSNLNIDVMHGALGVEQKMLMKPSTKSVTTWCGTSLMHPSLTRAIRIESLDKAPDDVMRDVFEQYAQLVQRRTEKVKENAGGADPDMRTGWLLWQNSLREFLYFEEPMTTPNLNDYRAVWSKRTSSGSRLGSKNLWIYERATDRKRYSVTTQAGIKIQPYFDVPSHDDPNLYEFVVQGEEMRDGSIRVWVTSATAAELQDTVGSLELEALSVRILETRLQAATTSPHDETMDVQEVRVTPAAYERLVRDFDAPSDELRFRRFTGCVRAS